MVSTPDFSYGIGLCGITIHLFHNKEFNSFSFHGLIRIRFQQLRLHHRQILEKCTELGKYVFPQMFILPPGTYHYECSITMRTLAEVGCFRHIQKRYINWFSFKNLLSRMH